nr:lytic transglycosylase domain-containing protein [uncultured Desulfuromonas sp.]
MTIDALTTDRLQSITSQEVGKTFSASTSFANCLAQLQQDDTSSSDQAREVLRMIQDAMLGLLIENQHDSDLLSSYDLIQPFTGAHRTSYHDRYNDRSYQVSRYQEQAALSRAVDAPEPKVEGTVAVEESSSQPLSLKERIEQLIERVAQQVELPSWLIHSVVSAESSYQPDAVSPAGAQGLMQLMPETAREMGVDNSFDPQQNLVGGSRYLKRLLNKYDGDLDHALAAYNWGQGNVDRKGLEQMPTETRNYIARIRQTIKLAS